MSELGNLPLFQKLEDSSNYSDWKFQMELYLIHENLWKWTSHEDNETEEQSDQRAKAKVGMMMKRQ